MLEGGSGENIFNTALAFDYDALSLPPKTTITKAQRPVSSLVVVLGFDLVAQPTST
ncbi:MAG: hypothetical protein NHB32_30350 [Fischerella sp. CENA71]|nr:hypothetical protein [Fischerella sp. CENA71]